ncbi:hypothetical protein GIB67_037382, partial [Kingdonia uniflora]
MLPLLLFFSTLLTTQASLTLPVAPFNFSFSSFGLDSCNASGGLICSGSAVSGNGFLDVTPKAQVINGTTSSGNCVGRILYPHPVPAWPAVITTTFTVRITKDPNSSTSGDGMAFVMAEDSSPSPVNSYGSFLGLFNRTAGGKSFGHLGVELDTYYNNEFDPDDNHIGIDTMSIVSVATMSLTGLGINLKSGREIKVKIEYDGWDKFFRISLGYVGSPLISALNHSIPMSKTVPRSVYVGFTGSTGIVSETHEILDWDFMSVPIPDNSIQEGDNSKETMKKKLLIWIPIVTGTLVLVILICVLVKAYKWGCVKNRMKREDIESKSRNAANAPKFFTLKELSKATQKFSEENLLGAGGFGTVYRGTLSDPILSVIAVKKILATSAQGEREYLAEICTIGRLRHKNIVQLQGWCHERDHLLLVYEFMPNGSLDRYISEGLLDWQTRYKILTGLASALLYLHEECGATVVHRDVKPNNVMLDSDYNAHLGDFGLARLLQNENIVPMTMLAGTPGYLAPECSYTGKSTPESDVFSFGVVVLEVICGRRSTGGIWENNLVDDVWSLHGKGELLECVDEKLEINFNEEEVKRALLVGLVCSHPDPKVRPSMRKVVQVFLNSTEPLMDVPESRPTAIYVPMHCSSPSTANISGSTSKSVSTSKTGSTIKSGSYSETSPDEMSMQYG